MTYAVLGKRQRLILQSVEVVGKIGTTSYGSVKVTPLSLLSVMLRTTEWTGRKDVTGFRKAAPMRLSWSAKNRSGT